MLQVIFNIGDFINIFLTVVLIRHDGSEQHYGCRVITIRSGYNKQYANGKWLNLQTQKLCVVLYLSGYFQSFCSVSCRVDQVIIGKVSQNLSGLLTLIAVAIAVLFIFSSLLLTLSFLDHGCYFIYCC